MSQVPFPSWQSNCSETLSGPIATSNTARSQGSIVFSGFFTRPLGCAPHEQKSNKFTDPCQPIDCNEVPVPEKRKIGRILLPFCQRAEIGMSLEM